MKSKLYTFRNVSASFYLASLAWCFLFPLVSITTGELKPRGLYLDENALLVRKGPLDLLSEADASDDRIKYENFRSVTRAALNIENVAEQYCSYLKSNFVSVSCHCLTKSMSSITQINVDHPWKPRSLEVTAVPILYHVSNKRQSFAFAAAVIQRLISSDWLSKRVIILLIALEEGNKRPAASEDYSCPTLLCPKRSQDNSDSDRDSDRSSDVDRGVSGTRYSAALSVWLREYHTPRSSSLENSTDNDAIPHAGLLRDSYVMDFSTPMMTMLPSHILTERRESRQPKAESAGIRIQLLVAGNNGQLPNMDILAAPLAAFPAITISEADQPQSLQGGEGEGGGVCALPTRSYVSGACSWCSLLFRGDHCGQYFKVLLGLFAFSEALVRGPSGLHGQFIRRNIDSLTLRPIASDAHGSGVASRMRSKDQPQVESGGIEGMDWGIEDLAELVTVLEHCIHYSSNLHGKHWAVRTWSKIVVIDAPSIGHLEFDVCVDDVVI